MIRLCAVLAVVAALATAACSTAPASRSSSADSTEVIPLQYIDATKAAEHLQSQQPSAAGAQIVVQPSTNAIVVVGSAAEVDSVRQAVRLIDRPS